HQRQRARDRRLRQDQAEGSEDAVGSDQPPRSGGQYGSKQDRREVTAISGPPALSRRAASDPRITAMKTRSLGIAFAALLACAPVRGFAEDAASPAAPANAASPAAGPNDRPASVP